MRVWMIWCRTPGEVLAHANRVGCELVCVLPDRDLATSRTASWVYLRGFDEAMKSFQRDGRTARWTMEFPTEGELG